LMKKIKFILLFKESVGMIIYSKGGKVL